MSCIPFLAAFGAAISGCVDEKPASVSTIDAPPAFYRKLDNAQTTVDSIAARDIISVYRRNNSLPTIAIDELLQVEAENQVAAMAKANTANRSSRANLQSRLSTKGFRFSAAVENVSAGYHTLAEAFSGWRQSPPHNSNMLHPRVRRMGIATAYVPNSKYKVFWALVMTD